MTDHVCGPTARTEGSVRQGARSPGGATKTAAAAAEVKAAAPAATRPAHDTQLRRSNPSHIKPAAARSQQPQQQKEKIASGEPARGNTIAVRPVDMSSEAQPPPGKSAAEMAGKTTRDSSGTASAAAVDKSLPGVASLDPSQVASRASHDAALPAGKSSGPEVSPVAPDKAPATRPSSSSRPDGAAALLPPEPSPMESGQLQPDSQNATPHTIPKLEPAIQLNPSQIASTAEMHAPTAHPQMLPSGPLSNGPSAQNEGAMMPGQMQSFPPGFTSSKDQHI